MSFGKGRKNVPPLSELLEKVSEFDILHYYLGIEEIPCVILSPLRVEKNPSFGLYSPNGTRISYRDFVTNESGGTFNLLGQLWGISFPGVIERIEEDLPYISSTVNNNFNRSDIKRSKSKIHNSKTTLKVKTRDWREHDLEYWGKFGINKDWLAFGNIYPVEIIIIEKRKEIKWLPADKYAYVYVEFKDDKESLKIYQPFSKQYKWISKHDHSVWDLWEQLPKTGDKLIITSSRKDALSIWANTGIPSTGLQGEGYLPKAHVIQQLKNRFKEVYVLYDNDFDKDINYGHIRGSVLAETFGLKQIEIPTKYQSKDPSDLYLRCGKNVQRLLILKLITDYEKEHI